MVISNESLIILNRSRQSLALQGGNTAAWHRHEVVDSKPEVPNEPAF